ncbi:nitroreductase family protein [Nocardioides jishulii]|uniref:Nitroreductase family protein n=1 Tax=Nocardioides jishulii TaxID=2575440 RepID=A0A4V5TKJ6_9ACTN|nr:nitroreductase family protein [Nocardioides jishulii]QCX26343.1 nitroreductase family protein [Nocardioides jishulii]TKI63853.1 nitroreductase family protein [Nocardioides jishulii]
MEFREVVRRRRMVRSFTDEPVPPAALDRMLDHATRAPSAGFSQGWAFLRLDTPEDVTRFWRATSPDPDADNAWLRGMRTAPALVVPLAHKDAYLDRYAEPDKGWTDRDEARWVAPYWFVDTGMASLMVLLTAVDEGLGACFFGIPVERVEAFRAEFGVPAAYAPIGAVAIGHPDGSPRRGSPTRRTRRGVDEVVHRGHWGG